MTNREYRKILIENILKWTGDWFTIEELEKEPIYILERIAMLKCPGDKEVTR